MTDKIDSPGSDPEYDQLQKKLGVALQKMREAKGWSQAEVARHIGVSRQAVSMWEAGTNQPTARRLSALFELFDAHSVADAVAELTVKPGLSGQSASTIPFYRVGPVKGFEDRFTLGPDRFESFPAPNSIAAASNVICFLMRGTSMVPWRSPSEPIFVDLESAPTIGDHALIRLGKLDPEDPEGFLKGPFIVRLITDVGPESVRTKSYLTNIEETFALSDTSAWLVLEWHEIYGPMASEHRTSSSN